MTRVAEESSNIKEIIKAAKAPSLRIDGQRASPRRAAAFVFLSDPDAAQAVQEWETQMCIHCQYHWRVVPGSGRERGWCVSCNGALCGKTQCFQECRHWEKKLEDIEAHGRVTRNLKALRR